MNITLLINDKQIKNLHNSKSLYHLYDKTCIGVQCEGEIYLMISRIMKISQNFQQFIDHFVIMIAHETCHVILKDEPESYSSEREEHAVYKLTEELSDWEIRQRRAMYWKYRNNIWCRLKRFFKWI